MCPDTHVIAILIIFVGILLFYLVHTVWDMEGLAWIVAAATVILAGKVATSD